VNDEQQADELVRAELVRNMYDAAYSLRAVVREYTEKVDAIMRRMDRTFIDYHKYVRGDDWEEEES
jgi:hypothetical protein